jgi:hypothetical protein
VKATIDIEAEFNAIVKSCGGMLVSDIVGPSPSFSNTDYIFHSQQVIGELKCLTEDKSKDPVISGKLKNLWSKWKSQHFVVRDAPNSLDFSRLPNEHQTQMYKVMGEPIRRQIQKANKQIRETKEELNLPDYRGVLFIANDGNFILPPAGMVHYIQSVLKNGFRQIRHFVFFTINLQSKLSNHKEPVLFWISFSMEDGPEISEQFTNDLFEAWAKRHEELTGTVIRKGSIENMEAFWNSAYIGKDHQ